MVPTTISPLLVLHLLTRPTAVFENLADARPSAPAVFFGLSLWLGMVPPVLAYVGTANFGWNLGTVEPLFLSTGQLLGISLAYFLTLLFGFVSSAFVSRWMSSTYGARHRLGVHFALITVVGAPLAVGSIAHLYPHVFLNVIVLVPTLIWSMYLLYRGLPITLRISPERGVLMASSIVAYLLVSAVSLLGLTVVLWSRGIGPRLGI